MSDEKKKKFNKRAFVALTAAISGMGLPLSGLANHLLQAGPVGLSRHAWMAAHWSLGILFIIFAVWHVAMNRRVLLNHFKGATDSFRVFSREFKFAVVLTGIPVLLAVLHAFIGHLK